ncbi:MAG: hypothetical protein AAGG50_08695 [Bacteroidota bacterium]
MGRETAKASGSTFFDPLYAHVEHVDWSAIEAIAEIRFSEEAREFLLECTDEFARARAASKHSFRESHYEQAKLALSDLTSQMLAMARQLQPWRSKGNTPEGGALRALLEDLDDQGEEVRRHIVGLAKSLAEVRPQAAASRFPDKEAVARNADARALDAFVAHLLKKCTARRARSKQSGAEERNFDGMAVGPTSAKFRRFAEALLSRKITRNQMRDAFARARQPDRSDSERRT